MSTFCHPLWLIGPLLALAPAAPAQSGAEPAAAALGPAIDEGALITVYGTRSPRPAFSYPGMVSVLDRDSLDRVQPSSIADVFRAAPSVQFAGGPRRTGQLPSIRGFGRENILILVDGARQSFISAHDGRFFLDPELLVRAEAVRGPSSALYGSGAVGGVLAFETASAADLLAPGQTLGLRLRGGYQTANREGLVSASAYARNGEGDAALLGAYGRRRSGDIRLGNGVDLPSRDRIETWLVNADLAPRPGLRLRLGGTGFANRALEPNNGQGLNLGGGSGTLADVEKDVASDTLRASFGLAPPGRRWLDADISVYRTASSVDERELAGDRRTLRDITTTGASARNRAVIAEGDTALALLVGLEAWQDEQLGRDSGAPGGIRDGVPNGRAEFLGAHAQLEADLLAPLGLPGRFTLIPGVRYDRFQSEAGPAFTSEGDDTWSARLASAWQAGPFLLFGSWNEAFRAPSLNELYLSGTHFAVPHPILGPPRRPPVFVVNRFVPNPDLAPERTETLELGGGLLFEGLWRAGDRLELKAARWRTQARDLIDLFVDFRFSPGCFAPPGFAPCSAGTTQSRNVSAARLSGVDVDLAWTSDRFDLVGAFSHLDGREEETGTPLGALTPDRGSLEARIRFPGPQLTLGARLEAAARFDRGRDPLDIRPAYATVDLYLGWIPRFAPQIRVDLRADNLADRAYVRTFAGVIEPGRSVKLTVSTALGR